MMRAALSGAALALLLTGCHDKQAYPIKSGTVVGKREDPADNCHTLEFVSKGQWNFACVSQLTYDSMRTGDWYEGE
jgi:hypothetical protein